MLLYSNIQSIVLMLVYVQHYVSVVTAHVVLDKFNLHTLSVMIMIISVCDQKQRLLLAMYKL